MANVEDNIKEAIEKEGFAATIPGVYRRVSHLLSRRLFNQILLEMFNSREIDLEVHYSPDAQQRKEGIPSQASYSGGEFTQYYYFVRVR